VDDFEASEADFGAPTAEVRAGIVEGVAEFDQHVEGHEEAHEVFAALVVDEGFDGDQGSAGWQGVVGGTDEVHLLFEIPVVKDHAHGDDIGLGERVFEEVTTGGFDAVCETGSGDVAGGNGRDGR